MKVNKENTIFTVHNSLIGIISSVLLFRGILSILRWLITLFNKSLKQNNKELNFACMIILQNIFGSESNLKRIINYLLIECVATESLCYVVVVNYKIIPLPYKNILYPSSQAHKTFFNIN